MRRPPANLSRLVLLLALAVAIAAAALTTPRDDAAAQAPYRPHDDADVLELLPTGSR